MGRSTWSLAFVAFVALLVGACAPPQVDDAKPFSSRSTKGDDDEDDDTTTKEAELEAVPPPKEDKSPPVVTPPIDAGASAAATTYVGTLEATPTVRFGGKGAGGNFCNYDVTLKNVSIEISALPDGQVIAATVKDTMVEASVPPCTFAPQAPSDQSFSFTSMTQTSADGGQLAFKGAAANRPRTALVVDIKKVGGSYEASASWQRTDQPNPLDWTVKTKITLGPR